MAALRLDQARIGAAGPWSGAYEHYRGRRTEVGTCVPIYPHARGLTAPTGAPLAPWLLTPSKDGACSATA